MKYDEVVLNAYADNTFPQIIYYPYNSGWWDLCGNLEKFFVGTVAFIKIFAL